MSNVVVGICRFFSSLAVFSSRLRFNEKSHNLELGWVLERTATEFNHVFHHKFNDAVSFGLCLLCSLFFDVGWAYISICGVFQSIYDGHMFGWHSYRSLAFWSGFINFNQSIEYSLALLYEMLLWKIATFTNVRRTKYETNNRIFQGENQYVLRMGFVETYSQYLQQIAEKW